MLQERTVSYSKLIGTISTLVVVLGIALPAPTQVIAQTKQGGGAFSTPKKKTKPTVKKQKPPKVQQQISFDGKYQVNMVLLSDNTPTPCRNGKKNFEVRNNRMALKTWALGDTIGGNIKGQTLYLGAVDRGLFGQNKDKAWNWSGSVPMPLQRGVTTKGRLTGEDKQGRGCVWRAEVTRIN